MSRTQNDWEDFIIFGTPLPTIDTPPVKLPNGVYVCMTCGKINNFYVYECEACDSKSCAETDASQQGDYSEAEDES